MNAPEIAITIRPEKLGDEAAIDAVTQAAFDAADHADGNEAQIVRQLRRDGDLALSLVAEDGEDLVGHIALSPVSVSDDTPGWFGLGPVSVEPAVQGKGVGSALVRRAIADLRQRGARGVVLLGDPAFYAAFGFVAVADLVLPGAPPEYFQALLLDGEWPRGTIAYAPAFGTDAQAD